MGHDLAAGFVDVHVEFVALEALLCRDFFGRQEQLTKKRRVVRRDFFGRHEDLFWDDQNVGFGFWRDVMEGQNCVCFIDFFGGQVTRNDISEDVFGKKGHGAECGKNQREYRRF